MEDRARIVVEIIQEVKIQAGADLRRDPHGLSGLLKGYTDTKSRTTESDRMCSFKPNWAKKAQLEVTGY